ncbi:hypothetical protein PIB30_043530 [Stylosanthes scabra]|uniref:Uncharacterized protein n=1 Tax=Stylosanthes scabra TaxID=79078 RepID=A0ABU6VE31_9FABA|nr:hypothetical protein [Stylosanthes scabra]
MDSVEVELSIESQSDKKQAEGVHTYVAQWPISSLAWSLRRDKTPRLAIASYLEDYTNKVELIHFNYHTFNFTTDPRLVLDHPYAPTNLMFFPSHDDTNPDLLATSGDNLRLWQIHHDHIQLKSLLIGNKVSDHSAITSFDWAGFDPRLVATSSVDTTCTIWDIEREAMNAQLVAHDKEVYDISWGGVNVFASVSGDGSVRVFDLRDKEKSTIIYENPVRDCPQPTTPFMELSKHRMSVNGVSWSPDIGRHLCSVGDDSTALIWEVMETGVQGEGGGDVEPLMLHGSTAEINHVSWSPMQWDWIAITFLNNLQLLRV